MKFLRHSAPFLLATASACFGLAIVPRSAEEPSVTTIFQFNQTGSQLENMAVRQSGTILTTRMDVPDIWEVNPLTHKVSKRFTIPEATGVLGIAEVTHDVFVLAAANLTSGSMQVWMANLNRKIPRVSLVTAMRDARLLNGVARWDDRTVLVADSTQGVIYKVDVKTGEYSVALADESMTVMSGASVNIGVNGIKVLGGFVYYTSFSRQLFCRIAVDENAVPSGPAQVIASGFIQDDFTLTPDGTAYIATMTGNTVVKVTPNGTVFTIAGRADSLEVASCSACQFGRTAADKDILYVASAGGLLAPVNGIVEPSKIVAVNLSSAALA